MSRGAGPATSRFRRSPLRIQAVLAVVVWAAWLGLGGTGVLDAVRRNVAVTLTMVVGSVIGGGTSEGGGAVAFPVFTKVLGIPAAEARTFTFLIQSVGMVAASIVILVAGIRVERRVLALGTPAGLAGVVVSVVWLAPLVAAPTVRLGFTVLLVALAIALVVGQVTGDVGRRDRIPRRGPAEDLIVVGAGLTGGLLSGVLGVGENTVVFLFLVLLFRVSERIATPTTVVLMSVVSLGAAFTHAVVLADVPPVVWDYWLAAVPVVVVGAPLGAVLCRRLSAAAIRGILVFLISVELVSTVLLVPITPVAGAVAVVALLATATGCVLLTRVRRYATPDGAEAGGPDRPVPRSPEGLRQ